MTASSNISSTPKPSSDWPWVVGLFSVVGLLVLLLATMTAGHVTGIEFSPDTLERRRFDFYEIPLVRWQVRAVRYFPVEGEFEAFLKTQPYFANLPAKATAWHLVRAWRGSSQSIGLPSHDEEPRAECLRHLAIRSMTPEPRL